MRWAMLLCAALASTAPVRAQETELSERDKRDGWVLLFDGKSAFGWTVRGEAKIADHRLHLPVKAEAELDILLPAKGDLIIDARNVSMLFSSVPTDEDTLAAEKAGSNLIVLEELGKRSYPRRLKLIARENAEVRSIKLRAGRDLKPLFNGKDLDGWTVFPGKKSKFDVKDGILEIHDGPGDLQTTAKYRNFILQLECKSNGKHLNSGVFFRCRANEYQNGYECQIQNGFGKEKAYDIEVFDPMTHKLFEKRKMLSGAIDFGTGSIYRRVPARSEVAKDGEWFTLTVLAVDNHFATWVDGIQQVDWIDNRPANDNARNGYRSEAGHISLQGHDPTTNLSFRNIRIQELP